jgi:glycine/D-amino acid oxidase-like deaminating enzyme
VNRRAALRLSGAALASSVASACAQKRAAASLVLPQPPRRFAPVRASADRVIRQVAGLRPFRASGFLVRGEPLGAKLLVHNYGHGGGGITLSWGTAMLAVEETQRAKTNRFAVIGCGAVGPRDRAASATQGRRGQHLRARAAAPDHVEHRGRPVVAGVGDRRGAPHPGCGTSQFVRASRFSYRYYQTMLGPGYGVRFIENYFLGDDEPRASWERTLLADLFPETRDLRPGEHPFPTRYVRRMDTMLIEPHVYLAALTRDFLLQGGRIVVRDFAAKEQLLELPEPVVVNCTGLGARALFGDQELVPVKGQLTVLLPQPEIDYALVGPPGLYMFPRSDGILLGGTFERGVETLEPDAGQAERILNGHARLYAGDALGRRPETPAHGSARGARCCS